jgi:hypothetical protein
MAEREAPRFTGISTYRDRMGRFSVRYPTDWALYDLEGQDGAMFVPNAADPQSSFSARITALDERVLAEDLEDLKAGVSEGLAKLSGCQVEESSELVIKNMIRFERVFTFREEGATRKRKLWLVYADKWLIVLTWQGSSAEEYEYWLAMVNYCFATFLLPDALWFATDRDLSGDASSEAS